MSVKKVLIRKPVSTLSRLGCCLLCVPQSTSCALLENPDYLKWLKDLSPVVDHCKLETKGVGDHHRPDIKERMTTVLAADDMYCVTCSMLLLVNEVMMEVVVDMEVSMISDLLAPPSSGETTMH